MNRKSFTLSEVLITLTVIGVVAAIVLSFLLKAKPDKDALFLKKALYTVGLAVDNATQKLENEGASGDFWNASFVQNSQSADAKYGFCSRVAAEMETTVVNCSQKDLGSYNSPQIETTDGLRLWGMSKGIISSNQDFAVERLMSEKEQDALCAMRQFSTGSFNGYDYGCLGITLTVTPAGKVYIDSSKPENEYASMLIKDNYKTQQNYKIK